MKSNNYVHVEVLTDNYHHLYTVAVPARYRLALTYIGGYYTLMPIGDVLARYEGSFVVWRHPEIAAVESRIRQLEAKVGV